MSLRPPVPLVLEPKPVLSSKQGAYRVQKVRLSSASRRVSESRFLSKGIPIA